LFLNFHLLCDLCASVVKTFFTSVTTSLKSAIFTNARATWERRSHPQNCHYERRALARGIRFSAAAGNQQIPR
jgi:hypothetical protein